MELDVQIHDDVIPANLREDVWKYINTLTWYATWKPLAGKTFEYIPDKSPTTFVHGMPTRTPVMWMHRACLASDDYSLQENHPIIWDLWTKINQHLGNQYTISGVDEDMSIYPDDNPNWQPPIPKDPTLKPGWRVYTGGQLNENIKRSHGVHKDTTSLDDTTSRTILYVANLEWYPSWFAECIFYPDGETGDHQQYQKNWYNQGRDFKIGWSDEGKIVSPVPGRIISYEGRTLHTTRPAAVWAKEIRKVIAFRVRKTS